MTFLPLLFLFFFLTSIPFPAFSQFNDRSTLRNLKRDLGDPLSLRLWNDTSSPCNWPRITCTAGNVTEINFQNQNFTGTVPTTICNFPNLRSLNLSFNYFAGEFPTVLYNCTKLQYLDLSQNLFNGSLPDDINRLAPKLKYLDLAANSFAGDIPKNIGRISKLKVLNVYMSEYDGTFPSEIGDLSELEELRLALNDKFTPAKLPTEFGKLKKLKYMWLEEMNLIGEISAVVFENMTDLKHVDLSVNNLTGRIPDEIVRHSRRFCYRTMASLAQLLYQTTRVNLSNNTFTGFKRLTKSTVQPSMSDLLGSNNNFTGKIPSFICELHSLILLDLSTNKFNGSIPRCIANLSTLEVLNLGKNHLSGSIPENISTSVKSLDIGHNQLAGKLPRSLVRISSLEVLNVESNKINDTFPFWLDSMQQLQVLVLRSNAFHGSIHQTGFSKLRIIDISDQYMGTYYMRTNYYSDSIVVMIKGIPLEMVRILNIFTTIDFSGNKFEGEIPRSVGLLKELHVLNLSNNGFTGHIPSSMGNLIELESLDVSQNKLSGEIPPELGKLSYLAYMNFSQNQFVGLVPGGTQFQTQPCSSFADNPRLFGLSLERVCVDIHKKTPQQSDMPEPEEDEEEVMNWTAAAIGSIPGISIGLTMGYILVSYKPEWLMNSGRNKRRIKPI
ncbi:unnamed protein product [Arabidopsis thaliana]|uniref:Receptor like protein n=1 Tax=Arabidopsis thaliana TaxID=3702 RepID=A0A7G2FA57_ARATH|nr:unnamed protein product [Arabidopsis thaliana]